jgi:hypothetical protein
MSRSTSPPVKAAAKIRATSMLVDTATLYHDGPSSTSGFGSTVTSVLTAP